MDINNKEKKDIRRRIADDRLKRIHSGGHDQGLQLPEQRTAPLVPFGRDPFIICEIKRKSPSKGDIDAALDPVDQAGRYREAGIKSVSVLTEEAYFNGALADLVAVKKAYPDLAVLRKDFLLDLEDIRVSHRAGADAFLLIASLLDRDLMQEMHNLGCELGMTPLVELHDIEDVEKARSFKPPLVGINSRNLKTFQIDPLRPLKVRALIDWDCDVIYESGISTKDHAMMAFGSGFSGILVGEAVVRSTSLIPQLKEAAGKERQKAERLYGALGRLYNRYRFGRPLVKVCGITNKNDAELAMEAGADMLGFILADSPRRVDPDFIRYLKDKKILKAGVVVLQPGQKLDREIVELLEEGCLDFIQFHGKEAPEYTAEFPSYKVLRVKSGSDLLAMEQYPQPALLIDAFCEKAYGGTGKRIAPELVAAAAERGPLWLAGGITPENVFDICREFHPDLIDGASGLEAEPGKKDPDKITRYFKEIQRYENL